ncbi:hypothetical protein E2542_SST25132 [Spatholobus suberectus]|nr:hypothetical protein E2542_SST25132 [Spatholobus suberectus]
MIKLIFMRSKKCLFRLGSNGFHFPVLVVACFHIHKVPNMSNVHAVRMSNVLKNMISKLQCQHSQQNLIVFKEHTQHRDTEGMEKVNYIHYDGWIVVSII